jgi:hypothetical protein
MFRFQPVNNDQARIRSARMIAYVDSIDPQSQEFRTLLSASNGYKFFTSSSDLFGGERDKDGHLHSKPARKYFQKLLGLLHARFPDARFDRTLQRFDEKRRRPTQSSVVNEFIHSIATRKVRIPHGARLDSPPDHGAIHAKHLKVLNERFARGDHRNSLRAFFLGHTLLELVLTKCDVAAQHYTAPIQKEIRGKLVAALNRGRRRLRTTKLRKQRASVRKRSADVPFIGSTLVKWLRAGRHRRRLLLGSEKVSERLSQLLRKHHMTLAPPARLALARRAFEVAPTDLPFLPAAAANLDNAGPQALAPAHDFVYDGGADLDPLDLPLSPDSGPSLSISTINIHNAHRHLPATVMALQEDLRTHFRDHARGVDLITVQETHASPSMPIATIPGYTMFQQPRITDVQQRSGGVAILVRSHLIGRPLPQLSRTSTSTQQAEWLAVRVSATPRNIIIFSLYRPPTDNSPESAALFRAHLDAALLSGDAVIVAGDTNIDYTTDRRADHAAKPHWLPALAPLDRLRLAAGHAPTTNTGSSEIDHIFYAALPIAAAPLPGILVESAGSDHKAILTLVPTFAPSPLSVDETGRINWRKLAEQPSLLDRILQPVRARLGEHDAPRTMAELCALVNNYAAGALGTVKGRLSRPKSDEWSSTPWWTGELDNLRTEVLRLRRRVAELRSCDRRRATIEAAWPEDQRNHLQHQRSDQLAFKQGLLSAAAQELQDKKRSTKSAFYTNMRAELNPSRPADISTAHRILNRFTNRKADPISHNDNVMFAAWTNIMAPSTPAVGYDANSDSAAALADLAALVRSQSAATAITHAQVLLAVSKLPASRAPGPDGIPNAVWRGLHAGQGDDDLVNGPSCDPLVSWMATYTSRILLNSAEPIEPCLQTANVVLIPKVPNPSPTEFRPISLLNTAAKFVEHIFFTRWAPRLGGPLLLRELGSTTTSQLLPLEQSGFCPKRNTQHELLLLRLARERAVRDGRSLHLLLLDQQKAFDSVKWPALIRTMAASGRWHHTEIELARRWIANQTRRLILPDGLSPVIYPNQGTPQGGVLSPILYNVHVNGLLGALDALADSPLDEQRVDRIVVNDALSLSALLYADDTTPLSYSMETMQRQSSAARKWAESTGSVFNEKKCDFIVLDAQPGAAQDLQFSPTTTLKPSSSTRLLGVVIHALEHNHMQPCPKSSIDYKLSRQLSIFSPTAGASPITSISVMRAAIEMPVVHAAPVAPVDEKYLDKSSAAACRTALGVSSTWNGARVRAFCGWPDAAATVLKLSLSLIRNATHLKDVICLEFARPTHALDTHSWRNLIALRLIRLHPALQTAHENALDSPAAITEALRLLHRGLSTRRSWQELVLQPMADKLWPSPHKAFTFAGHNAVAVFRLCEATFSQSWKIKDYFGGRSPMCTFCVAGAELTPHHVLNDCLHFEPAVSQAVPDQTEYEPIQHLIVYEYSSAVTTATRNPRDMTIDLNLIAASTAHCSKPDADKADKAFTGAVVREASAVLRRIWDEIKPVVQRLESEARARYDAARRSAAPRAVAMAPAPARDADDEDDESDSDAIAQQHAAPAPAAADADDHAPAGAGGDIFEEQVPLDAMPRAAAHAIAAPEMSADSSDSSAHRSRASRSRSERAAHELHSDLLNQEPDMPESDPSESSDGKRRSMRIQRAKEMREAAERPALQRKISSFFHKRR